MKDVPIYFRGAIYVVLAMLPSLLEQFQPFVDKNETPSQMKFWWIVGSAAYAGLLSLRIYIDGSYQRHQQNKLDEKNDSPNANVIAT